MAESSNSSVTRRRFLHRGLAATGGLGIASLLGPLASAASAGARPPNFVFLYCDDVGWGDLGCYGNTKIRTPRVDGMAQQGLKFTDFYSCAPVCTPSRAGLLTGRYPIRCGLTDVLFPNAKIGMPDTEITLPQALKPLGYTSTCIGKWHLGDRPQFLPTRHGFDHFFGMPYSNDMKPRLLMRDTTVLEQEAAQEPLPERYTQEAIRFMEESKDRPFFLYLAYNMPHVPLAASARFKGKSAAGLYGDVMEEIDWSVGEVLDAIARLGLDQSTLAVFSSDNGPWLEKGKEGGSAGNLRDGKATTFEGGVREPCIARWPGHIPVGRVDRRPAIMLDWFPTFIKLAGGQLPTDRIIDGRDLCGVLQGSGARADENIFYYNSKRLEAVRSGRWKLKLGAPPKKQGDKAGPLMLFDLESDLSEKTNLAEQRPEIVARLRQLMVDFQKTVPAASPPRG